MERTTAFCCNEKSLPCSMIHLLSLLPPKATIHTPLPTTCDSAPLITSFLTAIHLSELHSKNSHIHLTHHSSMQRFRAIVKVSPQSLITSSSLTPGNGPKFETRYFVPFADDRGESYVVGKEESLVAMWKEIDEFDALGSLRPEGSGIKLGDGEDWEELKGKEALVCGFHGVCWEVKVWVRTS